MSKSYIPSTPGSPVFVQHWVHPGCIFPTACGTDPVCGEVSIFFPHCGAFLLCSKQNRVSSLGGFGCYFCHNPPQCAAQAGTRHSSRFLCSGCCCQRMGFSSPKNRDQRSRRGLVKITPQIHNLLQGSQYTM